MPSREPHGASAPPRESPIMKGSDDPPALLAPAMPPQPAAERAPRTTACYDNDVPAFVEADIARLYGSLFATLPHLRQCGKLGPTVSTYVTRHNGIVDTVLLFQRQGDRVTVLNELIALSARDIGAFSDFVFARYPSVARIGLNAVSADLAALPYPSQRFVCAEDIVVTPLTTVDAYTRGLSKNIRKTMRRHTNALRRERPSYHYAVLPSEAVTDALVRDIIGFNRARMAVKERISAYTDQETAWILALTRASGIVSVITIDGKVCAGAVCCSVADHYYMLVGAHDPAFDEFGLGTLCCYQSICSYIERGARHLHLLWGRHPYKTSLGGVPRRFDRITVYRSGLACLRHLDHAAFTALTGGAREARLWLVDAEAEDSVRGRMAARLWRVMRPAKRTLRALLARVLACLPARRGER